MLTMHNEREREREREGEGEGEGEGGGGGEGDGGGRIFKTILHLSINQQICSRLCQLLCLLLHLFPIFTVKQPSPENPNSNSRMRLQHILHTVKYCFLSGTKLAEFLVFLSCFIWTEKFGSGSGLKLHLVKV